MATTVVLPAAGDTGWDGRMATAFGVVTSAIDANVIMIAANGAAITANRTAIAANTTAIAGGYLALARTPDALIVGPVTRDADSAAIAAAVAWPDGSPGDYTALVVSPVFPGAVDSYSITYGSPVTKTYIQPTIARDPMSGAAVTVPPIVVT